jgi:2-methylcitrate dehydratase PrpD
VESEVVSRSEIISQWVAGVTFERLPAKIVDLTRLRILDVIGLSIAGRSTAFGSSVLDSVAELYPGADARLWGTNSRVSTQGAAFANGALSQALEYDDTHNESIVHISSPSVSAALALIDKHGGSGRDLITAIAIGNEISSRVGSVSPSEVHRRGFHPTGIFAPFGTAYLAGFLMDLAADQMRNAAGIVGSFASGLIQCWADGTQTKFLHPGWASMSGIAASVLARSGVTGPTEIFEGRFGLFASHLQDQKARRDLNRLTNALGSHWDSINASFKPFPAAHVIHPYIDALLRLRESSAVRPSDVRRITCKVAPYIVGIVCEPVSEKRRPATDSQGRVSLQYTLAEAFSFGRLGKGSYAEQSLRDPDVLNLADRIDYEIDESLPGPEQFKGVIRVELKDGTFLDETEEHNRGSNQNPMTESSISGKFRENVEGALAPDQTERLIESVLSLDRLEDASTITDLMLTDA